MMYISLNEATLRCPIRHNMPISSFLISFGLILATEIGDKTMLTAMCLSAQYKQPWTVLLSTILALTVSTLIAVLIGMILSVTIPVQLIIYLSGILFIGLGVFTLARSESEEVDECDTPGTFLSMFTLILLSELGDKSQITILAAAVQSLYPALTLFGAVCAFLVVNMIGVFAGDYFANRVSVQTVKKFAGVIFIFFGVLVITGII